MDAQALFREGVLAIREKKDIAQARKLLTESLRIDPGNEMAWLWLSRTTSDPQKQLFCVDRALNINPSNEQALALKNHLAGQIAEPTPVPAIAASTFSFIDEEEENNIEAAEPTPAATSKSFQPQRKLTKADEQHIKILLNKAQACLEKEDTEGAIEQWVRVLNIQVDHELAISNAVRYLSRLKYLEDAKELVWRAINAGTTIPSIYLTAIDIARYEKDFVEADTLRETVIQLPNADDELISMMIEHFIKDQQHSRAEEILSRVLEHHPKSQRLLNLYGDILNDLGRDKEAVGYYDRAARLGTHTKAGKEADKKVLEHAPLLTDKERGSFVLAWREAAGFGVFFLLLGWQDAGLNLLAMDLLHWFGVILSIIGGYLVITATSSPQQRPLATWLGGTIPDKPKREKTKTLDGVQMGAVEEVSEIPIIPYGLRVTFGVIGGIILVVAFGLVFSAAIQLLQNPVRPYIPTVDEIWAEFGERFIW